MYDFATAIIPAIVSAINAFLALVDPTTFVGGLIALALVGGISLGLVSRLIRMAR